MYRKWVRTICMNLPKSNHLLPNNSKVLYWTIFKFSQLRIFQNSNFLWYGYFKVQIFLDTDISKLKFSQIRIFQHSNFLRYGYFKIQIFSDTDISKFKFSQIRIFQNKNYPRYWYFNIQIYSDTDISTFKFSQIRIFQHLNFLRYGYFKIQIFSDTDICRANDPRPEGFETLCTDHLSECRDFTVCQSSNSPVVHRLCQINQLCQHSDGRSSTKSLCQEGQLFDAFTNECVPMIRSKWFAFIQVILHTNVSKWPLAVVHVPNHGESQKSGVITWNKKIVSCRWWNGISWILNILEIEPQRGFTWIEAT